MKGKNFDINSLNIEKVERIEVFKADYATEKYGENGKNGVIIITTK